MARLTPFSLAVVHATQVRTRTKLAQYNRPTSEVIRRFRDFAHLEHQLQDKYKGSIIPPLPEKNAVQKFQMSQEFTEERRRALQVCLKVPCTCHLTTTWRRL